MGYLSILLMLCSHDEGTRVPLLWLSPASVRRTTIGFLRFPKIPLQKCGTNFGEVFENERGSLRNEKPVHLHMRFSSSFDNRDPLIWRRRFIIGLVSSRVVGLGESTVQQNIHRSFLAHTQISPIKNTDGKTVTNRVHVGKTGSIQGLNLTLGLFAKQFLPFGKYSHWYKINTCCFKFICTLH